jgi:hypothetical protein
MHLIDEQADGKKKAKTAQASTSDDSHAIETRWEDSMTDAQKRQIEGASFVSDLPIRP